jgi:hypothetical protein
MSISPETLAAFADNQLGPDEAARVAALIDADPALAAEVAAHRRLRETLGAHFAPILAMPLPDQLTAPLTGPETVVDLAAERAKRRMPMRWMMGGAIAASLAVGLVVGSQMHGTGEIGSVGGATVAQGTLDDALTHRLSGESGETRILLSFRTDDGHFCRGFESGATSGIACHDGDRWAIRRLQANGVESDSTYRQAGSPAADILAAAQDMAADGTAMNADAERTARDTGWTRRSGN